MKKRKEILVIASALDLRRELTMSWKWWSLLKGLWAEGADLTVLPFEGKSVETPWWRAEPRAELQAPFFKRYFSADYPRPDNWASLLPRLLKRRPGTQAILYMGTPPEFFGPLVREVQDRFGIKQLFLDGESAENASRLEASACHLDVYEHVLTTQPGQEKIYKGLGAKRVQLFPWWSDPDYFTRVESGTRPEFDLMAWGQAGEEVSPAWSEAMAFSVLREKHKWNAAVVGGGFVWPADLQPRITHLDAPQAPDLFKLAHRSLVHLAITESVKHEIDGLALGRMIDLACMGCCVITHPFKGLDTVFAPGEDILVAGSEAEALKLAERARRIQTYRTFTGARARRKVLKFHTAVSRAHTLYRLL